MAFISGGIAISVPAAAIAPQADIVTTTIDIRDLETDRGVAKVYKSLSRRAERACASPGVKSMRTKQADDACAESLLIDFVQDVGHETLNDYHQKMHS